MDENLIAELIRKEEESFSQAREKINAALTKKLIAHPNLTLPVVQIPIEESAWNPTLRHAALDLAADYANTGWGAVSVDLSGPNLLFIFEKNS